MSYRRKSSEVSENVSEEQPEQDGGRPGWIAGFTMWLVYFIWSGFIKGLGIMLPTLQQQFGTSTSIIGWIIAMLFTMSGLICKFCIHIVV